MNEPRPDEPEKHNKAASDQKCRKQGVAPVAAGQAAVRTYVTHVQLPGPKRSVLANNRHERYRAGQNTVFRTPQQSRQNNEGHSLDDERQPLAGEQPSGILKEKAALCSPKLLSKHSG